MVSVGNLSLGVFFMFLLNPLYLLVTSGGRYIPEYNLLYLAYGYGDE